jgi:hypothetical protein
VKTTKLSVFLDVLLLVEVRSLNSNIGIPFGFEYSVGAGVGAGA